jgi:hypothetical protein
MPGVAIVPAAYAHGTEDREFVRAFLRRETLRFSLDDGADVVELLMAPTRAPSRSAPSPFAGGG